MRLFTSILLSLAVALLAGAASANTLTMSVASASGDNPIITGNDVAFGPGGGSVTYNLSFTSSVGLKGVVFSASFPGAVGSGTGSPTGGNLLNFGDFTSLGALANPADFSPSNDTLIGWAWASPSGVLSPGTFPLGTLTVTTGVSTLVSYGVLNQDDGLSDSTNTIISSIGNNPITTSANITVVPEPGTALLMGLGIAGLAFAGRREE